MNISQECTNNKKSIIKLSKLQGQLQKKHDMASGIDIFGKMLTGITLLWRSLIKHSDASENNFYPLYVDSSATNRKN